MSEPCARKVCDDGSILYEIGQYAVSYLNGNTYIVKDINTFGIYEGGSRGEKGNRILVPLKAVESFIFWQKNAESYLMYYGLENLPDEIEVWK